MPVPTRDNSYNMGPSKEVILTYHEIYPGMPPYSYGVSVDDFKAHLTSLSDQADSPGQHTDVQITFDDGHLSHLQYAVPVLAKFGRQSIFFVTTGWTGERPDYLDWGQLEELLSAGHQVQAHGWYHRPLTECSNDELREEIERPKKILEDRLSIPITALSVPHGRWDRRVLSACAKAGYQDVYVSDPWIRQTDIFGIRLRPRIMIKRGTSTASLLRLIAPRHFAAAKRRTLVLFKDALRTVFGERFYHESWRFFGGDYARTEERLCQEQPKRVLHLISSGGFYGAESMLLNLTKSLQSTNCHPIIGVFRNTQNPHVEVADRGQERGLDTQIIDCRGPLDYRAVRQIRTVIRRKEIDVIHSHGSKANFYAVAANIGLKRALVATYHLDWPDRGLRLYAYQAIDRILLRSFKRVVAVSEAIELSLRHAGISRHKLSTIPNGIDIEPFAQSPAAFQKSVPHKKTAIGVVARLTPQKGHTYLLQAAQQLVADFPDVVFVFVGDGPDRQALERKSEALGIREHVQFAGQRTDMPVVYAGIDIFVLPSINEGMPMAIIEALAARRPVIATSVGAVPMLIRDGETGLLVPAANPKALHSAITRLLCHPEEAVKLAENGRRLVTEQFCAEAMARKYLDVYASSIRKNTTMLWLRTVFQNQT